MTCTEPSALKTLTRPSVPVRTVAAFATLTPARMLTLLAVGTAAPVG